jgi:hypothetical protein
LVDNQSELNGGIATCREPANVQVSGVKLPLSVFISQSFDDWHFGLSWSGPALTLDVNTQRQKRNCWQNDSPQNDIHNQQRNKNFDK